MFGKESAQIEFKETLNNEKVVKDIIAFANTKGGTLYIGIADAGNVAGLDDPRKEYDRISALITDNICPSLYFLINYTQETIEGKHIIVVNVQEGTEKPYYIKSKGITPSGVYIRDGARSINASRAHIRKMLIDFSPKSFEEATTANQGLTFEALNQAFEREGIVLEESHKKSLGIINRDDEYTNLALILSDQCPHTTKATKFSGKDRSSEAEDQIELTGSVIRQRIDALAFVRRFETHYSEYVDGIRKDTPNYPEFALRESIVNSIVHRDYSMPRMNNYLSVYTDKIEVASYGGLVEGITEEDILRGFSAPRNSRLAFIFVRLGLMEQYGYGIPRIFGEYLSTGKKPSIVLSPNVFRLILPDIHYKGYQELDPDKERIIKEIQAKGSITRAEIESVLGISRSTALGLIKEMQDKNLIQVSGAGPSTKYILS